MRFFPIFTAAAVVVVLYYVIFERDTLIAPQEPAVAEVEDTIESGTISVVAVKSTARAIESAVLLRGQTEADRQVDVRSETQGLVISHPLEKGSNVSEGQLLCEIDPGTRAIALEDAKARLAEALARLPEAEAGVPAAEARVSEAEARVVEATARFDEAVINKNAADRLSEGGFASESRVAAAEAGLESARAGISSAESALKAAASGVAGAQSGILAVKAGIQSAEAGVASAEKEIQRLQIRAPFDGLLESRTAEIGSLLQPGALCATVIRLDPIKVVGFAPETEVDQITVGSNAGARLASGREVFGTVTFLSRSADPQTRTFRTEITVANGDLSIRDGQTAEILIQGAGARGHLLPQSSMTLNNDGALGVRIVDEDSRAQFVPATLLRDTIQGVWLGGLPEEADIIVVGQEFVTDDVAVEVTYQETNE